jgi:hypothetical protein
MTTHSSPTRLVTPKPNAIVQARTLRRPLLAALSLALSIASVAFAANPNQGTLNPGSAAALQWVGDALGGPSVTSEAACQDGINCDVFTIHLTGSASDYAGKQLIVRITFSMLSDYDLYVHKDTEKRQSRVSRRERFAARNLRTSCHQSGDVRRG